MTSPSYPESLYLFPKGIIIQDRLSAIQYSGDIIEQGAIERCLVIWVDGPVQRLPPTKGSKRLTTAAIRYLDFSTKQWVELVAFNTLPCGTSFALEAEMIAIHEAFRKACELHDDFDHLLIFTGCQSILEGLRRESSLSVITTPDLIANLLRYANRLYDLGITAELHWVPAHSSAEGNERVDEIAKRFRRSARAILAKLQHDISIRHLRVAASSEHLLSKILLHYIQSATAEQSKTCAG